MAMPRGAKKSGTGPGSMGGQPKAPGLLKVKGAKPSKPVPPKPQPNMMTGPAFKKGGAVKSKCCK